MRIDLTSPEGNTLTALGIARRAMKQAGYSSDDITALSLAVMNADSATDAREKITTATDGMIQFFDPDEE